MGVPCANSAHSAEGQCAHGVREPCANSATGSSQSWNAEDPLAPTVVVDETPPSPGRGPLEDVSTCGPHRCDGRSDVGSPVTWGREPASWCPGEGCMEVRCPSSASPDIGGAAFIYITVPLHVVVDPVIAAPTMSASQTSVNVAECGHRDFI